MVLAVCLTLGTYIVSAQSISLYDFLGGEDNISSIRVNVTKQPHASWYLSQGDEKELVEAFKEVVSVDEILPPNSSVEYDMTIFHKQNGNDSALIHDNGLLAIINKDGDPKKIFRITNNFRNTLNRALTTQSDGYGFRRENKQSTTLELSDWAKDDYQKALDKELLPRCMTMGYMRENIPREQFCDLIVELLNKADNHEKVFDKTIDFADTRSENVKYLVQRNIIFGKSDINFAPNDFLTREEAATILCRSLAYLGNDITDKDNYLFDDDSMISEWAKESVYKMKKSGVMIGMEGDIFSPQVNFTKEQAIAAALRIFEMYIDNK